jgi:hypothetical protein
MLHVRRRERSPDIPTSAISPRSVMKTYLLVQLDSEGAPFSEVTDTLEDLGFRREAGSGYDFVYDWGHNATVKDSLRFADQIQEALRGKSVYFRIESVEDE